MKLTIKQLSIIEGCCERNAKSIKKKILFELGTPGKNTISDIDLSNYRGIPLQAVALSLEFNKSAFICLKDFCRLFGVKERQAANTKRKIIQKLNKKEGQKLSVLELSQYLKIHHVDLFALMDESISEKGIKRVNELSFKNVDYIKYFHGESRDYVAISEYPEFWEKYKAKMKKNPAFNRIIHIVLV